MEKKKAIALIVVMLLLFTTLIVLVIKFIGSNNDDYEDYDDYINPAIEKELVEKSDNMLKVEGVKFNIPDNEAEFVEDYSPVDSTILDVEEADYGMFVYRGGLSLLFQKFNSDNDLDDVYIVKSLDDAALGTVTVTVESSSGKAYTVTGNWSTGEYILTEK